MCPVWIHRIAVPEKDWIVDLVVCAQSETMACTRLWVLRGPLTSTVMR